MRLWSAGDTLAGHNVVPGFTYPIAYPVARLFA